MTDASTASPAPAPRTPGPFAVFGAAAVVAAVGAVFEVSYWVGVAPTSPSVIGTALGIAAALVAFFAWGAWAPRNE